MKFLVQKKLMVYLKNTVCSYTIFKKKYQRMEKIIGFKKKHHVVPDFFAKP